MAAARRGPSIRDFLSYYVLVLLAEHRRTILELVKDIEVRSAGNRSFRRDGALRPAAAEVERVIYNLADRGWVRLRPPAARWGITRVGRRARREMEQAMGHDSDSKGRAVSKLITRLRDAPRGSYVLDVGTGEGFLARRLVKRGFRVLGIDSGVFDYSKDSIEKARQRAASEDGALEFREADVTELRRPNRGFDYIVSSEAVHCMRSRRGCLEAIHRLLRPGGRFLAVDFLVGAQGFLAHGFHCFLALSREEWEQMLPAIGFHEVHTYIVKDYLLVDARKAVRQHGDRRAVTTAGRKADAARPALTIPRRRDVRATL